ncbi:MAG: type I methionyl aminopeptidase [Bdellovibrionales bacterium]|jgi:methionyl aminopeptidase|nr:type I methionyl aminopeptidase [Bdellovibrionales bacterium]
MTIKTKEEIEKMRRVCQLAARCLEHTGKFVRPGITTNELDKIADDFARSHGATSAPLGYKGYPKSICTSVNHVICHGVPDDVALAEGDIVNLDITCLLDGFHGDTSATFFVGEVSERARLVTDIAKRAMEKGIEAITPFGTTGDIGFAINKFTTKNGFYVVEEIGGHGIGRVFHEDPFVPSFGKKGRGDRLLPGGTITVEPMVNETDADMVEHSIPNSSIQWYTTADKTLSAQFEHTVLITENGPEILTLP